MALAKKTAAKTEKPDVIEKVIITNRRATFDYAIDEKFEGGLALVGSEVKSMRAGKVELVDAYATVENDQLWLKQMYIAPFEQAKAFPHEPRRARKVLVHKSEIARIHRAIAREGMTLVPLRLYWKRGVVKVELGLAKGKKAHDKRADIAAKTADREARAAMGRGRKERG
ncbi:MAG: SsrA-binding protein SmpB [Labilithrix sp.]|nr:SsrA-binding protein SmpB [Labilithrix sp.]MCW5809657.1 SsrA-binding protein SmpB [Labilithrix sp.]